MIKSKKSIPWPTLDAIQDAATRAFGDDLGQLLSKAFRDIYDDLFALSSVERVTALPTAGADYRGQFRILDGGTGVEDSLKLCVKKSDETYTWKGITLV